MAIPEIVVRKAANSGGTIRDQLPPIILYEAFRGGSISDVVGTATSWCGSSESSTYPYNIINGIQGNKAYPGMNCVRAERGKLYAKEADIEDIRVIFCPSCGLNQGCFAQSLDGQANPEISVGKGQDGHLRLRDYIVGIARSTIHEVYWGYRAGNYPGVPVMIGSSALRKAHDQEYPRSSDDIDYDATPEFYSRKGVDPVIVYGGMVLEALDLLVEKLRRVYGNRVVSDVVVRDTRQTRSPQGVLLTTYKCNCRVLGINGRSDVSFRVETNIGLSSTLQDPEIKDVLHPYPDKELLQLGQILVQSVPNIMANKIWALTGRLASNEWQRRTSRLKELFDQMSTREQ